MSVSSQGQLVGFEVAGQTLRSGFLSNTLCMWSELKFVVVQGNLLLKKGFFLVLFLKFSAMLSHSLSSNT